MFTKQGALSTNVVEMGLGTEIHAQHGRDVMASGCLRYLAFALLLTALLLAVVHFTIQVI